MTKCPVCKNKVESIEFTYRSSKFDRTTNERIFIPKIKQYKCTNNKCLHSWLPRKEEHKIHLEIMKRTREFFNKKQIDFIRKELGFKTKGEFAELLGLSSKDVNDLENKFTSLNVLYNLVIQLLVLDRKNFDFVCELNEE